jgi:hypothetical protein
LGAYFVSLRAEGGVKVCIGEQSTADAKN